MFEGLRKKLSDAVKGFIKKEETKVETAEKQEEHIEKAEEPETIEVVEEKHEEPVVEKKIHVEGKKNEVQEKEEVVHEKKEIQKPGKEELIKLSLTTKIKSVFLGTIRLSETEIDPFLETLKVSMLESDVSYDTTDYFIDDLHSKLSEKRISSRKIKEEITDTVRGSLLSVLQSTNAVNMDEFVSSHKSAGNLPVKLLFLGPNGAGKTTTIAKMAHRFKEKGMTTVLSASDTFRAAAIEQIEHHAKKLGITVIKSTYGADPASIAFDAIAYAKAHGADVVLIDSAGRQETNKSLINEVQKMVRIAKPDLTVFVGESTAGNRIAEQIKEFNKFVKIDGIILTKLDCDAKGGGALSISHTTGIPILFFGVGEDYNALMPYSPSYIVDAILPAGG
ncbi:MAG: signal recognition particle-docking protein FtsY [Candidatus Micrarchaeaceae archaeon]